MVVSGYFKIFLHELQLYLFYNLPTPQDTHVSLWHAENMYLGLSLNAVLHCNFEEMDNILYNKIETSKDYHALSMSKIADNFILNPIKNQSWN